ncbi:hydrophobic dipeptide epimerase [Pullulanibacillus camelliae]|uniref:Dipeptide epimerase n=1 Tax=Pullulanibacillus camelliae TaxID=1707096 RepID=A0A8J2YIH9_9BACL|nr:dipeptide epimerase [Pullulanibacillus camelliae]GGE45107.1 hydrophobic dipeptide epimerase [Pullulanibacillus camelliae]
MNISQVYSKVVLTPFRQTFHTTYGKMTAHHPHLFVQVMTDTGQFGIGEASPLPFVTGETADIMKIAIDQVLAPAIQGLSIFALQEIHKRMNGVLGHMAGAKSAIDMALWDLQGKVLEKPIYQLIGAAYKDEIPLTYVIGSDAPDRMAQLAKEKITLGFTTLKVKIGANGRLDIEAIKQIRQAIGPEITIRVDANQGYTVAEAIRVINAMADYDIDYVEQPVPYWNIDGLARLRAAVSIPIMADESLYNHYDALELIKREAVDLFAIKLIKCGGIYPAIKIAQVAEAAGIECVLISPWDTLLGTYANLHLSMVLSGNRAHEMVGPFYISHDPFGDVNWRGNAGLSKTCNGIGITTAFDQLG